METAEQSAFDRASRRFISTCVETALGGEGLPLSDEVHLHVCGDSSISPGGGPAYQGSSPRVWRQQIVNLSHIEAKRFISTCVETARESCESCLSPSVHLHVCGDISEIRGSIAGNVGSSPRVWRQQWTDGDLVGKPRFISTCVETVPIAY